MAPSYVPLVGRSRSISFTATLVRLTSPGVAGFRFRVLDNDSSKARAHRGAEEMISAPFGCGDYRRRLRRRLDATLATIRANSALRAACRSSSRVGSCTRTTATPCGA